MRRTLPLLLLASLLTAGCMGGGEGGVSDRDGDGVSDANEAIPRTITIQKVSGPVARSVTSDPDRADTDGDGILDPTELGYGIDPRDVDTDGDGLLDGASLTPSADVAAAWRARGIVEEPPGTFLGELSQCPEFGGLKPEAESSDRPVPDRIPDAAERMGWNVTLRGETRHVASDPCYSDADRDGLPDHDERDAKSDPNLADSDGDGTLDGSDADPAADLHLLLRGVAVATNRTDVTVRFASGAHALDLREGARGGEIDVDDQTSARGTLRAVVLVSAADAEGRLVALTPNPGGVILTFDLLAGTVAVGEEAARPQTRLSFQGEDGSLAFDWAALRR